MTTSCVYVRTGMPKALARPKSASWIERGSGHERGAREGGLEWVRGSESNRFEWRRRLRTKAMACDKGRKRHSPAGTRAAQPATLKGREKGDRKTGFRTLSAHVARSIRRFWGCAVERDTHIHTTKREGLVEHLSRERLPLRRRQEARETERTPDRQTDEGHGKEDNKRPSCLEVPVQDAVRVAESDPLKDLVQVELPSRERGEEGEGGG